MTERADRSLRCGQTVSQLDDAIPLIRTSTHWLKWSSFLSDEEAAVFKAVWKLALANVKVCRLPPW